MMAMDSKVWESVIKHAESKQENLDMSTVFGLH